MGKSTLAYHADSPIFLATEVGYKALPGAMAQDITSWADLKQALSQLKKAEVKSMFKTIVIDTIDVAADMCVKYICNVHNVNALGEIPYGQGWVKFKTEFNDTFRSMTQLGYSCIFIGHDKEAKDSDGNITNIRPALSNSTREVIGGMADIYGYARQQGPDKNSILILRDKTGFVECGCRFKYVPDYIELSYDNLVKAINDAIEKEAAEHGGKFITDERAPAVVVSTYDYDKEMATFSQLTNSIMSKDQSKGPLITDIVERYLGRGNKVSETTRSQAEMIFLINNDLKEIV